MDHAFRSIMRRTDGHTAAEPRCICLRLPGNRKRTSSYAEPQTVPPLAASHSKQNLSSPKSKARVPHGDKGQAHTAPARSWSRNCLTIGTIPPSSTANPSPSAYALSNRAGHDCTTRLFVSSASNVMRATASGPATSSSAAISSRTVVVKPGRQTTRVCGRNAEPGTRRACRKFAIVVSGLATQSWRSSSGESGELPMGHVLGRPCSGSRMIPAEETVSENEHASMEGNWRTRDEGRGRGGGCAGTHDDRG